MHKTTKKHRLLERKAEQIGFYNSRIYLKACDKAFREQLKKNNRINFETKRAFKIKLQIFLILEKIYW